MKMLIIRLNFNQCEKKILISVNERENYIYFRETLLIVDEAKNWYSFKKGIDIYF